MDKEERLEKISEIKIAIDDLRKIKCNINNSQTENIKINIETKHWHGFGLNSHLSKDKRKIYISKELAKEIINKIIENKTEQADKLIAGGHR